MVERPPPGLDPAIEAYYDRAPEESRLELGVLRLEQLRSRELILRHAPAPAASSSRPGSRDGPRRSTASPVRCCATANSRASSSAICSTGIIRTPQSDS